MGTGAAFPVLAEALVGQQLRVVASFNDNAGNAESRTSAPTDVAGDLIVNLGVASPVTFNGTAGQDNMSGNPLVSVNETLNGLAGDDTLNGNGGVDTLNGGDGNDTMNGGAGNDILNGGNGNDTMLGGTGVDTLTGGAGVDTMTGNVGNDVFVFLSATDSGVGAARDIITDFLSAADSINLSGIDANSNTVANDAFTATPGGGTGAFTGVAGQIRAGIVAGNWIVEADLNGDSVADFQIQLNGTGALLLTDFVL